MLLGKALRSSTFRLAMIYVGSFSAAIFLLLGYDDWAAMRYAGDAADRAVAGEQAVLADVYRTTGRDGLIALIERRLADSQAGDRIYLLADASYGYIAGNLREWPAALRDDAALPHRLSFGVLPGGLHLLVGRRSDDLRDLAGALWVGFAGGLALMIALAVGAGISVTRRTIGRIEAINQATEEIMRTGLDRRIPLRGTHDEWDKLAENLNAALDRIRELVQDIEQVSDSIAHDLRTPLTRLRGRLERAGGTGLDPGRHQALIHDALAELDGVLSCFASLLRISSIASSERQAGFRMLDLAAITAEVVELFEPAAEEQGGSIELVRSGPVPIHGDRDLLFDALSNLIDNAIKHGGGPVSVAVEGDERGASIAVADHGPGIPAAECKHVLKRFYRLEHSRSTPGSGLGLSLVAAVARLHGASIAMEDNAPGLSLRLGFPPAARLLAEATEGGFAHRLTGS